MKKMLIIGYEYQGIDSVLFDNVKSINITDYQILLLDLTAGQNIQPDVITYLRTSMASLHKNGHPIVCILPRFSFNDNACQFFPYFNLVVKPQSGSTITFPTADNLMNIYRDYVTKHDIILTPTTLSQIQKTSHHLMLNNINEVCSTLYNSTLYLLHPPDKTYHKKAIASLIDYFSPDIEEEKEDKPEWVVQYELDDLGLQIIQNEIDVIDKNITDLTIEKNFHIENKERIAKWSDLITKQGKALEMRLKEAFELLGVESIVHEPNGSHGPDLFIKHKEKELIFEIEGSKGPIRIDKARELLHWIADAEPTHKGVLIGNPFREISPSDRPPENHKLFVKEAIQLSKNRDFVLVHSFDIFNLVCMHLQEKTVPIDNIINNLYSSNGEVHLLEQVLNNV